jgi:hypothetical protein
MSSGVISPQSEMPAEQGLTKEFRDSETYIKFRTDILARGIAEMWVDQIIWWYISRPDMFTCEAGKKMMAEFDERVAASKKATVEQPDRKVEEDAEAFANKFSRLLVNEGDGEIDAASATAVCHDGTHGDRECQPIHELSGLDAPGPSDGGPTTAAAAVPTTSAAAAATPQQDDFPRFTRQDERGA